MTGLAMAKGKPMDARRTRSENRFLKCIGCEEAEVLRMASEMQRGWVAMACELGG
jgi:hypothetical protein